MPVVRVQLCVESTSRIRVTARPPSARLECRSLLVPYSLIRQPFPSACLEIRWRSAATVVSVDAGLAGWLPSRAPPPYISWAAKSNDDPPRRWPGPCRPSALYSHWELEEDVEVLHLDSPLLHRSLRDKPGQLQTSLMYSVAIGSAVLASPLPLPCPDQEALSAPKSPFVVVTSALHQAPRPSTAVSRGLSTALRDPPLLFKQISSQALELTRSPIV